MTAVADAPPAVDAEQRQILALFSEGNFRNRYDEISDLTKKPAWPYSVWSRGRIYNLVTRQRMRVTESRIAERREERRARQREAFEELLNTTATADVLDFLDGIPDESVQLHVTSIPYNVGKRYGDGASADAMRHVFYHGWIMQVVSELARTLKDGGTIVLQVGTTKDEFGQTVPLDTLLYGDLRRAGLTYRNRIVWPSQNGLTPKARLAERYETALVFSKGEPVFNPNAIRVPQKYPAKRHFKGPHRGKLSGHVLGGHPTDVWNITHLGHNMPEKTEHPAQFPVAFPLRAILAYTMPGDVVCDVFCGSGSSWEAAVRAGRAFIGADLFYHDLRVARMANVVPDRVTPFAGVTAESTAVWAAEARRVDAPAAPVTEADDVALALTLFGETGAIA